MPGKVPAKEINRRSRLLRELSQRKHLLFAQSQLDKIRPVLFERCKKDGYMSGFTDNYLKIKHPYKKEWLNTIRPVRLKAIDGEHIIIEP